MQVLLFGSELKDDIPKDLYEVNQSEYNVELAKERSEFGAFPIAGHCMEGAGIVDGGTVVVDFTRYPRTPRYKSKGGDGSYDCCICKVDQNDHLSVKRYDGKWGNIHCVSTMYRPEDSPYGPGMQQGSFAEKIYGVVIASYGKDGKLIWKRDPSTFPAELSEEPTIFGENCGDPMPVSGLILKK